MEIFNLVFSAENIRTIILLVAVLFVRTELLHKLRDEFRDEFRARFGEFHKQLKENDFAHLERTIKALTYMLEKK